MTDWNNPSTGQSHSNELAATKGRDESLAKMDFSSDSNFPTNTIRWSSTNSRWEQWDGSAWQVLTTKYLINVDTVDGFHAGNSGGQIPISNGTLNNNLNSDLLDSQEGGYYLARGNHTGTQAPSTISPQGGGSGLNADQLDGQHGSFYRDAGNLNAGFVPAARFNDTSHGDRGGGSLHSVATQSTAGFMSAADKTKVDNTSATSDAQFPGGDFNSGEGLFFRWAKTGNVVTVSGLSAVVTSSGSVMTHSSGLSLVSSVNNFLPSEFRPIDDVTSVYYMDGLSVRMITVTNTGQIVLRYRDWAGNNEPDSDSGSIPTIGFAVPS